VPGACPAAGCTRSGSLGIRCFFSQALHFLAHPAVEVLERAVEPLIERRRCLAVRGR
jgi:hypothetical protein